MFVIGRAKSPRSPNRPADILARRRNGWMAYYLRNKFMELIENLRMNDEKLFY